MARPSRNIDQALLASGRLLFPQLGCTGLSVRRLAEHAGVQVGMFHYHFGSKDAFLRTLLQQFYEEMFALLAVEVATPGMPLDRLRRALRLIGRFLQQHGAVVGRIWADAAAGEPVAQEFIRANAPRHLELLLALLDEAERAGEIAPRAPMLRFTFLMGAVAAPMLIAPRVRDLGIAPPPLDARIAPDVLSDAAIAARADMAIAALRVPERDDAGI